VHRLQVPGLKPTLPRVFKPMPLLDLRHRGIR
jgi:hypothetical protein